ncbi:MAG: hypothetical protein NT075_25045 [Chloroflexi bacterium]|nr:hypothetical protein [Chloroflexota bacterium]
MGRLLQSWLTPLYRWWWLGLLGLVLGGCWLLPISGQVMIIPNGQATSALWPQFMVTPANPKPGDLVTVTDEVAWPYTLLTIAGQTIHLDHWQKQPGLPAWTWIWTFTLPENSSGKASPDAIFYTDCHTGCRERGKLRLSGSSVHETDETAPFSGKSTKLCVAFADPARNWHGRSGWVVYLTYVRLADNQEDPYWNVDELAWRVHEATAKGLRVLVRVDYAKGQTLPPTNDALALNDYLAYLRRLARDERLRPVYGFIIGSGPNAQNSNTLSPDHPITPEWVARLFNGYAEPVDHTDNAVQTIRAENLNVRVLVGPVRPWINDQDGSRTYKLATPWLNYMNTLVSLLDESTRAKMKAGFPLAAPNGFALHAPGRPDAPELAGHAAAEEPRFALPRSTWHSAQAGFQIYHDWLDIINAYPTTHGLPVYISATNTTVPDGGLPPAQNYPQGWLTNALATINAEPQVQALCWFMDLVPGDDHWDAFSLTRQPGRMIYAAEEFDGLLQR